MPWDFTVDLGSDRSFTTVELQQAIGAEYATSYAIQSLAAAPTAWTTVYSTTAGHELHSEHDFARVTARYVKFDVTAQVGLFSHALYEFGVYDEAPNAPDLAYHHRATLAVAPASGHIPSMAVDGDPATYVQANLNAPSDLTVNLGSDRLVSHATLVQSASSYASAYQIQIATAAAPTTWITVYNTTTSTGGTQSIAFDELVAKYVRYHGITKVGATAPFVYQFSVYP